MKRISCFLAAVLLWTACQHKGLENLSAEQAELIKKMAAAKITLPNGWSLTPAGSSISLDDLPLNLMVSPSRKLLAVTNNGQSRQTITLIDVAAQRILDNVEIEKSWVGLAFSPDERYLYASAGNNNAIAIYTIAGGKLVTDGEIKLGEPFPTNEIFSRWIMCRCQTGTFVCYGQRFEVIFYL